MSILLQINYLTNTVGIPLRGVENMVSISKSILGRDAGELEAVVRWVEGQGLWEGQGNRKMIDFLVANPTLLNYTPNGDVLEKGAARAALTVEERGGRKVAGLVQWREGAVFGTAPVAPQKPQKV